LAVSTFKPFEQRFWSQSASSFPVDLLHLLEMVIFDEITRGIHGMITGWHAWGFRRRIPWWVSRKKTGWKTMLLVLYDNMTLMAGKCKRSFHLM
jgi:hypothetical protein